jgi:hypothetical protein
LIERIFGKGLAELCTFYRDLACDSCNFKACILLDGFDERFNCTRRIDSSKLRKLGNLSQGRNAYENALLFALGAFNQLSMGCLDFAIAHKIPK